MSDDHLRISRIFRMLDQAFFIVQKASSIAGDVSHISSNNRDRLSDMISILRSRLAIMQCSIDRMERP